MEVVRFPPEANLNITTFDFDSLKRHSSKMFNILFEQFYVHCTYFTILNFDFALFCKGKKPKNCIIRPKKEKKEWQSS